MAQKHHGTDDLFMVTSGRLTIHLRDRDVALDPGEICVVLSGLEHCAGAETEVLLIEPRGTVDTGDTGGEMAAEPRLLS
jgi:mannose-6-phosphate isomerase-like protein (cupin superfamily)